MNEPQRPPLTWWMTAVGLFVAVFLVEHEWNSSLYSEYGNADNFAQSELDEGVAEGSLLRRVAFPSVALLGIVVAGLGMRYRFTLRNLATGSFLLFIMLIPASVVWADEPGLTIRRSIVVACGFVCVFGLASHWNTRQLIELAFVVSGGLIATGLLAELAHGTLRPWSGEYRFGGTTHPNMQAILCSVFSLGGLSLLRVHPTQRRWLILCFVIGFLLLLLTKSRTALMAECVALLVLLWMHAPALQRVRAVVGGTTAISGVIMFLLIINADITNSLFKTLTLGRVEETTTLTGRIPLWNELSGDFEQRPLLGYGYGSFWTPKRMFRIAENQGWQIPHAHSAYWETVLNLGIVGLVLLGLSVAVTITQAYRISRQPQLAHYRFWLLLLVYGVIYSTMDTGFVLPSWASFLGLLAITKLLLQPLEPLRSSSPNTNVFHLSPHQQKSNSTQLAVT